MRQLDGGPAASEAGELYDLLDQKGKSMLAHAGRLAGKERKFEQRAAEKIRRAERTVTSDIGGREQACDQIIQVVVEQLVNIIELRGTDYPIAFCGAHGGVKREREQPETEVLALRHHPAEQDEPPPPLAEPLAEAAPTPPSSPAEEPHVLAVKCPDCNVLWAEDFVEEMMSKEEAVLARGREEGKAHGLAMAAKFPGGVSPEWGEEMREELAQACAERDAALAENDSLRDTILYLQSSMGDNSEAWRQSCEACKQYMLASAFEIDPDKLENLSLLSVPELQDKARLHFMQLACARTF